MEEGDGMEKVVWNAGWEKEEVDVGGEGGGGRKGGRECGRLERIKEKKERMNESEGLGKRGKEEGRF